MSGTKSPGRVCAVTGANGFLGSRVCRYFEGKGWKVVRAGRRGADIPFSLEEGLDPETLRTQSISALIHCAYDFRPTTWGEIQRINVEGSSQVLTAARSAGVGRIVLISTVAAFPGCKSLYGRAKLLTEEEFLKAGAFVVRPGLIYGETCGGIVGTIERLVTGLPVVPLVGMGSQQLCTCHEQDLCELLFRLCTECLDAPGVPVVAASEETLRFREIVQRLARRKGRTTVLLIPVPWRLVWCGLKASEFLGLRVGLRSDSVVSLMHQNPRPDFGPLRAWGCRFRPLEVGLA
jgi:nucleoside-diphosphate-sugar epimerase